LGGTYEFRLRAFDNNGQPEAWPAGDIPEQSITFPTNCTPDVGEVDNTYQTAKPIFINSTLTRNFCQSGDVDWYRLDTSEWLNYMVSTTPKGLTGATVNLSVYAENGITLIKKITTTGLFNPTDLIFNATGQPYVYIKAESNTLNLAGNQVQYSIVVKRQYINWLPMIRQ
jgi:hypothetical protein